MTRPSGIFSKYPVKAERLPCSCGNQDAKKIKSLFEIAFPVLLIIFLLLLLSNPIAGKAEMTPSASSIRCNVCDEMIFGKYWKFGDIAVCDKCYQTAPKCFKCGIPTANPQTAQDKQFCPACYAKLPSCCRCGEKLLTIWSKKDPDGTIKKFCEKCAKETSEKCELCGKPLTGKYWQVTSGTTGRTALYCDSCRSCPVKCSTCGLPAGKSYTSIPDGRKFCSACQDAAISSGEYQRIFENVKGIFVRDFGMKHKHKPKLYVVDAKQLKSIRLQGNGGLVSRTGDNLGLYKSRKYVSAPVFGKRIVSVISGDIYVLDRLPEDIAFWVIAHEYAHAWYEERVYSDAVPQIVEGFAEWVAYNALIKNGLGGIAESLKNREDIYGRGLRTMLKIEKKAGFNGTLRQVTEQ